MTRPEPAPEQKSLVGYTIGKCKLIRICGRGAMGTVYKGMHTGLDIEVAVKILPPHLANNANLVERFMREAKLAARLNHPNTVRVYDVGEESGYYYLVMEFIDGTDALELIRKFGPQDAAVVADVGAGAARALSHAHSNDVIHRDIKPANLMLPTKGGVKVADFGLARALASESGLTMTGAVMGTPDYMAPEQAQGVAVGPKADIYSLGGTLYHLFVGKPPFSGATPMAVALQHVTNRIVVPEDKLKDDTSRALARMIHELTQKELQKRPGDLEDIASRLAQIARMNRRTQKLLFEGATLFDTAGVKLDAEAINKFKEDEATRALDKGRVQSPHLEALRKAAEKARGNVGAAPVPVSAQLSEPAAARPAPQIPPDLAELTQDMVREAKARARRSSGQVRALPASPESPPPQKVPPRGTSSPEMSPHRETQRPSGSASSRLKAQQQASPETDPSEWESYAAKSFPTFEKKNIMDGSAGNLARGDEQHSSWDGGPRSGSSQAGARPDFSQPMSVPRVHETRVKKRPGAGGGTLVLVVVLLLVGAGAAYVYFSDDAAPGNGGGSSDSPAAATVQAREWTVDPSGRPVTAVIADPGGDGFITGGEDGVVRLWRPGMSRPEIEKKLEGVSISALAARAESRRLAVGTRAGQVIVLDLKSLEVLTPEQVKVEGVTALAYWGASLMVGDARGRMRRDDGSEPVVVADDGKAVSAMAVVGTEIWVAAGTTLRRFAMESGKLKQMSAVNNLAVPLQAMVSVRAGVYGVAGGRLHRIAPTGLLEAGLPLAQPAVAATSNGAHLLVVTAEGYVCLDANTMQELGKSLATGTDRVLAMAPASAPGVVVAVRASGKAVELVVK
ncbi:MAG: protein kinase [Planctomycetes bacterium]|nr:protein kinase [Planctomycetota bacterium]